MNQQLEKTMTISTLNSALNAQIVKQSMRKRLERIPLNAPNAKNFSATSATNRSRDQTIIREQKLCATWNQTIGMICERRLILHS